MGWKASTIFIRPKVSIPGKELLEGLGFPNVSEADPEPFEIAQYPSDDRFFVGEYNGCTIISGDVLTADLFASVDSPLEQKLVAMFSDVEVCAVDLHSSMNLWGYIVFQNGKRIRERLGSADTGTILDKGEPLEEEKELLAQSVVGADGKRTYRLKDDQPKPYTEDQVGENFVFEMYRRYTGQPLNMMNDELFNKMFEGFNVEWPIIDLKREYEKQQELALQQHQRKFTEPEKKNWWKFW